ncbi:MAG: amidase, partial [Actinomycetota bacterium]|nr:amidase [Actinomycetota bacterium]
MATFITRSDQSGPGVRVAVKDVIDMVGLPTTAGSRAVATTAPVAARDASCLQGLRAAEASGAVCFVGKTNLHELAFGVTGINPWFGTPRNPRDHRRVPGGSSSGSAVAVADGEADLALGTDTGGSIRIPAACCGIVGLKPTWGRVDLEGVWPLAPTLDTVGPMARGVAGVAVGLAWLAPEAVGPARSALSSPPRIGRIRLPARPEVDEALDRALLAAGMLCSDVDVPGWRQAEHATRVVMGHEAAGLHGHLVGTGLLGDDV